MTESKLPKENLELKIRLQAMGGILRLLREAALQPDLRSLAEHVVNNPRSLLQYQQAFLVTTDGGAPEIIAAMGQLEINRQSPYNAAVCELAGQLPGDQPLEISREDLDNYNLHETALNALAEQLTDRRHFYAVPLISPHSPASRRHLCWWIMAFNGAVPPGVKNSLSLLTDQFGVLFWNFKAPGQSRWRKGKRLHRGYLAAGILAVTALLLATVKIPDNVAAEFEIRPRNVVGVYALFDAVVLNCKADDGATVKEGAEILTYDTERMRFQLAAAEAAFRTADAEYEQESQAAFSDPEKLARAKLLALRRAQAAVAIEEAQWFLRHSAVTAPLAGTVALTAGSADQLVGRAVRTGDKLFDILGSDGMIAEIMVPEKASGVLTQSPTLTLFLHTNPERPIKARVSSIRQYPELTEQNVFSYQLKAELPEAAMQGLQTGMRGVARLSGDRIRLGNYLFRSVILWWRGL